MRVRVFHREEIVYESVISTVEPERVAEQRVGLCTMSMRVADAGETEVPDLMAEPVKVEVGKPAKAMSELPSSKSSRIHSAEFWDSLLPPETVPTTEVPRVLLMMVTVPEVVLVAVTLVVMLSPVSTARGNE